MPVDPWSWAAKSCPAIQTRADLGGHRDSEPDFASIPILLIVWNLGTATSAWPKTLNSSYRRPNAVPLRSRCRVSWHPAPLLFA